MNVAIMQMNHIRRGWERTFFGTLVGLVIHRIRLLQPVMPLFTSNRAGMMLLFSQFSAHPWLR